MTSGRVSERMADITVDGERIEAAAGETLAAALTAAGKSTFRLTKSGAPRGLFCGMGVCFDCCVTVDGRADERACLTRVRSGMRVETRARVIASPIRWNQIVRRPRPSACVDIVVGAGPAGLRRGAPKHVSAGSSCRMVASSWRPMATSSSPPLPNRRALFPDRQHSGRAPIDEVAASGAGLISDATA